MGLLSDIFGFGSSEEKPSYNSGNINFRSDAAHDYGRYWGQTNQGEITSYDQDSGGEGNNGWMTEDAWRKPERVVAPGEVDRDANLPKEAIGGAGIFGLSIAEQNGRLGASWNAGRAFGSPVPGLSFLLGGTADTYFNFSRGTGTGGVTDDPGDDSVSEAQQRSQQYTPGARKESDTPSATAALVEPLTAAQRRKRALARSAITSTETPTGTLLGA